MLGGRMAAAAAVGCVVVALHRRMLGGRMAAAAAVGCIVVALHRRMLGGGMAVAAAVGCVVVGGLIGGPLATGGAAVAATRLCRR